METRIKELLEEAITRVIETDKLIREKHLENTQEFLNWQDKLNEISVN